MKTSYFLCACLVLLPLSYSCREENNLVFPSVGETMDVPEKGGSFTLKFQALADWEASVSETWLSIFSAPSGHASEGETELVVFYRFNPFTEDRTATIDFTAGKTLRSIAVRQEGRTLPPGAVNMGTSVVWAPCNLGASRPEEPGDYYAWGESESKTKEMQFPWFGWWNYKWYGGEDYSSLVTHETVSKYVFANRDGYYYGEPDNLATLEPEDDAAIQVLGGSWRMPSNDEWVELIENCDWSPAQQGGVNGYKVVSKITGAELFLPYAGYYVQDLFVPGQGYYWSSNVVPSYCLTARLLHIGPGFHQMWEMSREEGLSIRPVAD
jgi:hypothetical protein